MITIEDIWLRFESKTIQANASPEQRYDMRMAFYAGAVTVMEIIKGLGDKAVTDKQGMMGFVSLNDELQAYINQQNEATRKHGQHTEH